ncbi:MAG: 50S ribosomal protein L10 [Coriobacteriales bacterium]|nr:50S ribosomal protein L10 [Coriobacteriales bacterium]
MPTQAKVATVQQVKETLDKSAAIWVVDYSGLTVKQFEELRRELRKNDAEIKVVKNTLLGIALKDKDLPSMEELRHGPNGFVFSFGDAAASAKVIKAFAKANPKMEIKGGYFEGQVLDADGVLGIADLPSKPELIAMFARLLNEPMAMFARGIAGVADKLDPQPAEVAA